MRFRSWLRDQRHVPAPGDVSHLTVCSIISCRDTADKGRGASTSPTLLVTSIPVPGQLSAKSLIPRRFCWPPCQNPMSSVTSQSSCATLRLADRCGDLTVGSLAEYNSHLSSVRGSSPGRGE